MAKIRLGALAGQVSGSIGSQTYSHNRFGTYIRNRATPVQPGTAAQLLRRAAMATESAAWSALTAAQRTSWEAWAEQNPMVDSLGDKRIMTGHMAFVMLNSRLLAWGQSVISAPPTTAQPNGVTSISIAASAATQNVTITFAPDPIGAGLHLWIWGCKLPYASINYIKNRLRWMDSSSVNQASPYTQTNFGTVAGALVQNEICVMRCAVIRAADGQVSMFREARCTVGA